MKHSSLEAYLDTPLLYNPGQVKIDEDNLAGRLVATARIVNQLTNWMIQLFQNCLEHYPFNFYLD